MEQSAFKLDDLLIVFAFEAVILIIIFTKKDINYILW
jgi:hypothetical protein